MPIESDFQDGTFVVTIVGEFPRGHLIEAITGGYLDPRFTANTPVLIDFRQSMANPSSADVHEASRIILGRRPPSHRGKWAIVTRKEPLRFGLARMAALTMESQGATMAVFTETEAALRYLGSSQPA